MFIGREIELAFLQDKYDAEQGQLVVLYGRRRVGKTETLREFCKDKPHVFLFLHTEYGQGSACKVFKTNSERKHTCKTVHF